MEVTLTVSEAKRTSGGWSVSAELLFHNSGDEPFDLDKAAAGVGGRIYADLFDIRTGDRRLQYIGMTKKRGVPGPDDCIRIGPGGSFKSVLEIGALYEVPDSGRDFTVTYEATNHFSKDSVRLKSNAATFSLRP